MLDLNEVREQMLAFPYLQTPEYAVGPASNVVQITLSSSDYQRLLKMAEKLSNKLQVIVGVDELARAALLRGLSR